ncbi:MAG: NAD(P)H-dependent oxidoreductase [Oleispira sp.]|nr:NAD(P)H-dependent oxidoreductase [Oleispira sp.]
MEHAQVYYRDLNQEGLGHLTDQVFSGFQLEAAQRNEAQQAATKRSDTYIAELKDADALVLAVPMYNFSTPSTVKAWIDHIARAGVSFSYGENGPVGLLNVKRRMSYQPVVASMQAVPLIISRLGSSKF